MISLWPAYKLYIVLGLITVIYLLLCVIGSQKIKSVFRKMIWILPILLAMVIGGTYAAVLPPVRQTEEECYQMIEHKIAEVLQQFEKRYDCQGTTAQVEYIEMSIRQPTFELGNVDLLGVGWIDGAINVAVDAPFVYPYLEKDPESYTVADLGSISIISSNLKSSLFDGKEEIGEYWWGEIQIAQVTFLDSEGNKYFVESGGNARALVKNEEVIFEGKVTPIISDTKRAVCSWCSGDGKTHDWNGNGRICWKCGGDGWLEYEDKK